jgi:hypothetical protein
MQKIKPPKGEQSNLNNVDRGFAFMLGPEIIKKEEKIFFNFNLSKVISFFRKQIHFCLTLKITSQEK